jgi:hypothetical protein
MIMPWQIGTWRIIVTSSHETEDAQRAAFPGGFSLRAIMGLPRMLLMIMTMSLLVGCAHHHRCGPKPAPVTCAQDSCCTTDAPADVPVVTTTPQLVIAPSHGTVETPVRFLAVGYGNQGNYAQYTLGQQKLMAMRAAQVDAYRNLAEQVHGFRVWGNTAVSAFVTQNDSVRTYVDTFIRGARLVNMTAIGDGNFEATVELTLPPDFADCVRLAPECASFFAPKVVTPPVVAPSATYTSP